jgi:hypothetical protein
MSSIREFSLPYKDRTPPKGCPKHVWAAYAAWADFKGPHEERVKLWDKAMELKKPWFDIENQKWRDTPVYPDPEQLNLFNL